jgi:hypothetical protein
MQPIPNPGEPGAGPYYDTPAPAPGAGRLHHRYAVVGGAEVVRTPNGHHRHAPLVIAAAPAPVRPRPAPKAAATTATAKGPVQAPVAAPTPEGSQKDRIAGLTSTLAALLPKAAVLTGPDKFVLGAASDVVLTVPASFNDRLISEAKARGLQEEAAAASLSASLSGAGYGVMPAEAQSVLIAGGRASEFRWTVIQHDRGAGPLRATVSATLLGGGAYPMDLGAVDFAKASDSGGFWRVAGGILLILLGALAAAWLARSRGGSRPSALAQRASTNARHTPLDMSGDPKPPDV